MTDCAKKKIEMISKFNEQIVPYIRGIEKVEYEVFHNKEFGDNVEYLVITFKGGAISVCNCTGNSNACVLEEFTKMQYGGHYDEVDYYENMLENPEWEVLT